MSDRRYNLFVVASLAISLALVIAATVFVPRFVDARCQDRQDGRNALRATVERAYEPGAPTDFTAIPSYADLDPATQRFLDDLALAISEGGDGEEVRDSILESIPPIEC